MAAAGPGGWGEAQLGGQEDTQSENTCPLGQTRPGGTDNRRKHLKTTPLLLLVLASCVLNVIYDIFPFLLWF